MHRYVRRHIRRRLPLADFTECASSGRVRISRELDSTDTLVGLLVEVDVSIGGRLVKGTTVVTGIRDTSFIREELD